MSCFELENWQLALLKDIKEYLDTCFWNKEQKQMLSPFDNTGETFQTNELIIKAYDWVDDNTYNLKYKDIIITWYKYIGRGTTINKKLTNDEWIQCYNEIRNNIQKHFGKYAPDKGD